MSWNGCCSFFRFEAAQAENGDLQRGGRSAASIPWSGTRNSEKCKGFIDGSGALAWRGILFAKPPVKELRWRAPQDPEPWEGVMKTQEFSFPCTQLGRMFGYPNTDILNLAIGSEDCLYVNIWRTPISHSQMHSTEGVYYEFIPFRVS